MKRVVVGLAVAVATGALAAGTAHADKAPPTEAELLKKSCDKGNAADCFKLASMHRSGEGAPQDASKAAGLLKKACEGGHGRGCFELAGMARKGEGLSRDLSRTTTS